PRRDIVEQTNEQVPGFETSRPRVVLLDITGALPLVAVAEESLELALRHVVDLAVGLAHQILLGVGPGAVDGIANHENRLDIGIERGDFFDDVAIARGVTRRGFAAHARPIPFAVLAETDRGLQGGPPRRVAEEPQIPGEIVRLETRMVGSLQSAEEEQLLGF